MREVASMKKLFTTAALAVALFSLRAATASAEPGDAGVVKVSTEPAGAMVYAESATHGPTPVLFELAPGKHTLIVTRDGYAPVTREVEVQKDRITRIKVRLVLEPGQGIRVHETRDGGKDAGPGTVSIATEPPGFTVFMNDVMIPLATPVVFDLKAGVYEMRLETAGKVVYRKTVFVRAGEITELDLELAPRRRIDESDPWQ
jgi:hypothetical protein